MKHPGNQIEFRAIFSKATTLVDGGWRISFDVDASQSTMITFLTAIREHVLSLNIDVIDDGEVL